MLTFWAPRRVLENTKLPGPPFENQSLLVVKCRSYSQLCVQFFIFSSQVSPYTPGLQPTCLFLLKLCLQSQAVRPLRWDIFQVHCSRYRIQWAPGPRHQVLPGVPISWTGPTSLQLLSQMIRTHVPLLSPLTAPIQLEGQFPPKSSPR